MEVLAKGKGGRVTDRLKEAGGNAVSRRTETSYKAERLGEAAQHVEAQDSSRTVNDAVVQLQFTFLSGETCPTILAGLSRKGYWRLSRTLGTHTGMTNAWLAEQGVISLKELWVNIHYPEGKASKHRLPR